MSTKGKKYLVVKGCAGLGTRLFTICGSIDYALKTNRTLIIDWTDGQFGLIGENVFNEYFELKGIESLANLTDIPNYSSLSFYPEIWKLHPNWGVYDTFLQADYPLFHKIPSQLLFTERLKMLKGFWLATEKKKIPTNAIAFFKQIIDKKNIPAGHQLNFKHHENVLFYIDFIPKLRENLFQKHIQLKTPISKKIEDFFIKNQLDKNSIGVHVRFSDKKPDKEIESLFKAIESIGTDYKIFLATDNQKIHSLLSRRFKNIIEYPKLNPSIGNDGLHQWAIYNNKTEYAQQILEESIIDMWLLSKCEYLIYQGNSSFSKISLMLHSNKNKTIDWN